MRRTHLRGRENILKRVFIQACGLNLGLVLRKLTGVGTPRALQGLVRLILAAWTTLSCVFMASIDRSIGALRRSMKRSGAAASRDQTTDPVGFTTGC
jgi:hypothetical protein